MTTKATTQPTRQRNTQASAPADTETPIHVELAAEAVLEGWTRDQVIGTLISRISRDRRYLAYRKACNRRTSYDDEVQLDMRALALAVCWLSAGEGLAAPATTALDWPHTGRRASGTGYKSDAAGTED